MLHYWEFPTDLKIAKDIVADLIKSSIKGKLPINKNWKILSKTSNFSDKEKQILVEYLLCSTVKSFGYSKEKLKEIRLQRRRAKAKLKKIYEVQGISAIDFCHGRFCFFNGQPSFIVFKDSNEEITLAIERMIK